MPALLKDQPPLPPEFAHLLPVLSRFPAPIDWARLEAWARMTRRVFAQWELDALDIADALRQR